MLGGLLYLRRLHLVQTPWFAVMLHWIVRPDPQPDMHDHPVSFLSVPLRGHYVEQRSGRWLLNCADWARWNFIRATDRHRIRYVSPGGCLTLCFAGPVTRSWGFHTSRGFVPWREYQH